MVVVISPLFQEFQFLVAIFSSGLIMPAGEISAQLAMILGSCGFPNVMR